MALSFICKNSVKIRVQALVLFSRNMGRCLYKLKVYSKWLFLKQKYSFLEKSLKIFYTQKIITFFSYTCRVLKTLKMSFFFFFVWGILIDKPNCSSGHRIDSCSSFTCLRKSRLMYYLYPSLECLSDSKGIFHLCASRLALRGSAWYIRGVPGASWALYLFIELLHSEGNRYSKYKWIENLIIPWTLCLILCDI